MVTKDSVYGCLLGCAIGDALGLSCESMSRNRQFKMFKNLDRYHFLFNKGMVSDDTEHICMTAQALIFAQGDSEKFNHSLEWKLRFWLLGLPAGVGFATLRSILKMWFFIRPSGVFSAGNGPAMRSPILGVCYGNDFEQLKTFVKISTSLTHTDPKAYKGALAIALAAHMSSLSNDKIIDPDDYYSKLVELINEKDDELLTLIKKSTTSVKNDYTTQQFATDLGLIKGVSGYMYHTVPVVIHCWLRNQKDFIGGLKEIIRCGGDTDTTAAILGAIIGSKVGSDNMPKELIDNLFEWPRTVKWIEKVAKRLSQTCEYNTPYKEVPISFVEIFIRNIFFMLIVIIHIIRRLLPPY